MLWRSLSGEIELRSYTTRHITGHAHAHPARRLDAGLTATATGTSTPPNCLPASARPCHRPTSLTHPAHHRPCVSAPRRRPQLPHPSRSATSLRRPAPAPDSLTLPDFLPSPAPPSCVPASVRPCPRLSPLARPAQLCPSVVAPLPTSHSPRPPRPAALLCRRAPAPASPPSPAPPSCAPASARPCLRLTPPSRPVQLCPCVGALRRPTPFPPPPHPVPSLH